MPYLIDGYNLLYAMGVLRGRVGPAGLEKARLRLLGLLAGRFGAAADRVTIVFDAAGAPAGAAPNQEHRGLHVRFSSGYVQADDLIEELVRRESAPKHLRVVSDDHRLQQAARRRGCIALGCEQFMQEVSRPQPRQAGAPEKRESVSAKEAEEWLREFSDLADDPALHELFEPYDWGEGGPPEKL